MMCLTGRNDISASFLDQMHEHREPAHDHWAFTNSTSRVMVTSSPTRMPPVSSAAFQTRPKSFRLILVVAEIAIRVLPQGSFACGVSPSRAKVTLRVTPRIVRSPPTFNSPSPATLILVDLNDKVGNFSTC